MGNASNLWVTHRDRAAAFAGTNVAFDTLTRTLAQANLNTFWEVRQDPLTGVRRYGRQSDLHFAMGSAASLLEKDAQVFPGQALFFQGPFGRATAGSTQRLSALQNASGFFVRFSELPQLPTFLQSIVVRQYRFRLYEWLQPTEELKVFQQPTGLDWFRHDFPTSGVLVNSTVLAENVFGMILLAEIPEPGGGVRLSYGYDSRDFASPGTVHQLPPRIRVTMLVLDDGSAERLARRYGSTPPPVTPPAGAFQDPLKFEQDLQAWDVELKKVEPPVIYRVYTASVLILNSKWSL